MNLIFPWKKARLINVVENCNTFFWNTVPGILLYCNETNIRGTCFADLCCSCGCQKVPLYFICTDILFCCLKIERQTGNFFRGTKYAQKLILSLLPHILKVLSSFALISITFLNTHSSFHIHVIYLQQEFLCHVVTRFICVLPSLDQTFQTTFKWVTKIYSR